ncbi:hypothetical protein ACKKBF_B36130 [Auxenochlorella protothecoides x Auxenochlorella symbiontica]
MHLRVASATYLRQSACYYHSFRASDPYSVSRAPLRSAPRLATPPRPHRTTFGLSSGVQAPACWRRRCVTAAASGMASLTIERVPCLSDNYAWLLHEPASNVVAIVDPSESKPVVAALERSGLKLTHILNTHHHWDHTGGNEELKARFGATVIGPAADRDRIPGIDVALRDGERYSLGAAEFLTLDTPGHTRGHVTYYFPSAKAMFSGDTLFSLGCGRFFEGTPAQMQASLDKLRGLPQDTRVFCGHEYTAGNARFAVSVDPDNEFLREWKGRIDAARAKGLPTVPSLLEDELEANPFLRPNSPAIRKSLGIPASASSAEALGAIRAAKDKA